MDIGYWFAWAILIACLGFGLAVVGSEITGYVKSWVKKK
jgi:hypothetical protein